MPNQRRRFFFLLILFLVLIPISVPALQTDNIRDELSYLSQDEIMELQGLMDEIITQYDMDMVIVITDDVGGKSSMNFADDYYDDNGYGIGYDASGLLLLINMEDGEYWMSTAGEAIRVFTDNRIDAMGKRLAGHLSKGDWYRACLSFVNDAKRYMSEGIPQGQYTEENQYGPGYTPPSTWEKMIGQMNKGITYVIALIASVIITAIASAAGKRQNTTNLTTYEEEGSFQLINTRDDYIRETTTRVRVNDSSSGGSGNRSSTHRSSSGRSHGGGGGKF